jgi:predicted component of type VI protein secretion system
MHLAETAPSADRSGFHELRYTTARLCALIIGRCRIIWTPLHLARCSPRAARIAWAHRSSLSLRIEVILF